MKQTFRLFSVALVAGAVTLGGYKLFVEQETSPTAITPMQESPAYIPTSNFNLNAATNIDFTAAAEKTIHAVVHVKNKTVSREANTLRDYFFGGGSEREMIGTGSGVIINKDGFIITNNHVIDNATSLEVTLNNNKTYMAELIGTDPQSDIALIKIDANEDLPYVPFGDSNGIKVGEWVLAVGNPFNLTSTVTAGIVSAKARDLNEWHGNPQSFIQTDAAVNRGNSGGALVNTSGELVGINTAITSETGSYVGYSFAVPSNVARKIIEDIIEYGDVQRGILGIRGSDVSNPELQKTGISETEGVYVSAVEKGSGAERSGVRQGDVIQDIDGQKIAKFSDLTGYLGSKRPNDIVDVTVIRDGKKRTIPVTLILRQTYESTDLGLELRNANRDELKTFELSEGVKVQRAITRDMRSVNINWDDIVIVEINNQKVSDIKDVKSIMENRVSSDPIKMTFVDDSGQLNSFIFR